MCKKYINFFVAVIFTLGIISCEDMLEESPKSNVTPEFFQTTLGLQSGIVAAYSGLRWFYGPDGPLCFSVVGTDEFQTTNKLNGSQASFDTYDKDLSPSNGSGSAYWSNAFTYINMCNGVIQYGEAATGLTNAAKKQLLAEAHFLRAYYYYLVTMYYGAVPLDLGSGRLNFNLLPVTTSVRDSRADVFVAIINDLTYAKDSLPDKPAATGRAAKPAAMHFLAKAYLTRASLGLGNASADYQSAYNEAIALINTKATYGVILTQDFANINLEGHENDPEVLFNVQRTWTSSGPKMEFDESNDGSYAVSNKGNRANFFFTAGYENVKIKKLVDGKETELAIVPRNTTYQRPWRMFLPTKWLVMTAFADKVNDARWDGSFRTEWNAGVDFTVKGRTVKKGELALKLSLNETEIADTIAGDSIGKYGVIYKPYALYYWGMLYKADGTYINDNVQFIYPNLKKFDDTKRANMNYDSNRPFILARLGETYLIAAEAALNLNNNTAEALRLIKFVRERAAYRPNLSAAELDARKAAMAIAESDVTLDFILDERSRELCGESWRWIDLVRTGKLVERIKNNNRATGFDATKHLLRPIPKEMIDLLSDPAQKAKYQNPGY